jgi:hypothetical protein
VDALGAWRHGAACMEVEFRTEIKTVIVAARRYSE